MEIEALERTYNKAYTQVEIGETSNQKIAIPIAIPRFKPVKK
jgi:hypothetical protein